MVMLALLVAVREDVEVKAVVPLDPLLVVVPFGLVYEYAGCPTVCESVEVVTENVLPCECDCTPCWWDGISEAVKECVSSPPLCATEYEFPEPTTTRPSSDGRLKVVTPSPGPKFVPITEKSVLYVSRDTAEPSQGKNPAGIELPANMCTEPIIILSP